MERTILIKSAASVITRELGLDYPENRMDEFIRGLERTAELLGGNINYLEIAKSICENQTIPEKFYTQLSIALTINETYFFREKPTLDFFKEIILKEIREAHGEYIIWSAGCSSGEEPYTIAILLKEGLSTTELGKVKIIATDISDKALRKAKEGVYTQWSFRETPLNTKQNYFTPRGNEWQISADIKAMVSFGHLNLFKDNFVRYFKGEGRLNLIFCRNVLMYFSHENIRKVSGEFHKMLCENGWFVTSQVELNNELFGNFGRVYSHGALFYRKSTNLLFSAINIPVEKQLQHGKYVIPKVARIKPKQRVITQKQELSPEAANPPENNYQTAVEYAGKGEFQKAIEILDNLISGAILNADFFYLYGTIYSEMDNNSKAAEMFRKSLYIDPGNILSAYMLGSIYKNEGKSDLAKRYFANAYENLAGLDPQAEIEGSGGLTAARLAEIIKTNL